MSCIDNIEIGEIQWSQRRNQTVSAAISQCLHGDGGQLGNMECCSSAEVKVTPINPSLPALNICKIMPRFILHRSYHQTAVPSPSSPSWEVQAVQSRIVCAFYQ